MKKGSLVFGKIETFIMQKHSEIQITSGTGMKVKKQLREKRERETERCQNNSVKGGNDCFIELTCFNMTHNNNNSDILVISRSHLIGVMLRENTEQVTNTCHACGMGKCKEMLIIHSARCVCVYVLREPYGGFI